MRDTVMLASSCSEHSIEWTQKIFNIIYFRKAMNKYTNFTQYKTRQKVFCTKKKTNKLRKSLLNFKLNFT